MKCLFLLSSTQENLYKACTIVSFGYVFSCCNVVSLQYSNFLREKKRTSSPIFTIWSFYKDSFLLIKYIKNTPEMKKKNNYLFMYYIEHNGKKKESIHSFHIKCRETFGLLTSGLVFIFGFMQHNTELCAEYIAS